MSEENKFKVELSVPGVSELGEVTAKSVALAKDFLDALIMPSARELGLFAQDKIRNWRFNNQIKMLVKTRDYCISHNIQPKTISPKLLVPLLEQASLEDDQYLQDKWANLLGNLVDSEQNIENHVFPYLLGQISRTEFEHLEEFVNNYDNKYFMYQKNERLEGLLGYIKSLEDNLILNQGKVLDETIKLSLEKIEMQKRRMAKLEKQQFQSEQMSVDNLLEFEIQNLVRLGIIKEVTKASSDAKPFRQSAIDKALNKFPGIEIKNTTTINLTELGFLLIKATRKKE